MKIAMIGAGYVGLVSGICLAEAGHDVVCVDRDPVKIDALSAGKVPIFEPGLADLLGEAQAAGRLRFSRNAAEAARLAEVIFIAVGTPARPGDGHADLSHVRAAAREIAGALDGFKIVVIKSTVPVGTGDDIERIIGEVNPLADVAVVSNPEFLREGSAIGDFKRPDRIVIGIEDERARLPMAEVYRPIACNRSPVLFTRRRTAELAKYAANAFLAMKVTFINEVADLCEKVGADVGNVARAIGLDSRIGQRFLEAGPGFGGSCFPKDTMALMRIAQDHDSPLRLIETTVAVNDLRKRAMARKVIKACGGSVRGLTIAVLGLTFKANTDDMREAPSLALIQALEDAGASIRAHDPAGMGAAARLLPQVTMAGSPDDAAAGADALVIVTDWDLYRSLDLYRLSRLMRRPVIVDMRNMLSPEEAVAEGFDYHGVGRGDRPTAPGWLAALAAE